jgi:hypothetical protein
MHISKNQPRRRFHRRQSKRPRKTQCNPCHWTLAARLRPTPSHHIRAVFHNLPPPPRSRLDAPRRHSSLVWSEAPRGSTPCRRSGRSNHLCPPPRCFWRCFHGRRCSRHMPQRGWSRAPIRGRACSDCCRRTWRPRGRCHRRSHRPDRCRTACRCTAVYSNSRLCRRRRARSRCHNRRRPHTDRRRYCRSDCCRRRQSCICRRSRRWRRTSCWRNRADRRICRADTVLDCPDTIPSRTGCHSHHRPARFALALRHAERLALVVFAFGVRGATFRIE